MNIPENTAPKKSICDAVRRALNDAREARS